MSSAVSWNHDPSNWWHVSANRVWGCEKVSPACDFCYAEAFDRYAGGSLAGLLAGAPGSRKGETHWGRGVPRLSIPSFGKKMRSLNVQARKLGVRYRVFANSMSDWLDPAWDPAWLADFIETIADCKELDFLLLTKRPALFKTRLEAAWRATEDGALRRKIAWWIAGGQPMNVWAGATVENQEMADSRIARLLQIGAKVHWLSMEPLLSEVNLLLVGKEEGMQFNALGKGAIGWVVMGGESGSRANARPSDPEWFRSIDEQCRVSGVPVWFKQWGEWVGGTLNHSKGKVMLADGGIFWTNPGHPKIRRWGLDKGSRYSDRVSALVGMKVRGLGRPNEDGSAEAQSNNYLLGELSRGRIVRELPVLERGAA